jgi:long-chain acyl-CoA synthetase
MRTTIYEEFQKVARGNSHKRALVWKKNAKWKSWNYQQVELLINKLAKGFKQLGIKKYDRVAILANNQPRWALSDLTLNKLGAISVPIHNICSKNYIDYILDNSKADYLIIAWSCFKKNYRLFLEHSNLEKIILIDKKISKKGLQKLLKTKKVLAKPENKEFIKYLIKKIDKITYFSQVLNLKEEQIKAPAKKSNFKREIDQKIENQLKDVATIIYTSGTTGNPKGVMLTNKNILANVFSVTKRVPIYSSDTFLSFLPLSHVFERTAGSYVPLLKGATIAYAQSVQTLMDDLKEINPTILLCVPKIFERVFEKLFQKIKTKPKFIQKLFYLSLRKLDREAKDKKNYLRKIAKFIGEKLILNKLKSKIFGKNLRFAISGGASINESILRFFKDIGVKILEGYGLTETAPIICVNSLEDNKIGSVGKPIEGIKVKISKKKEILVKGENVMKGYWNNEEGTKQAFTSNGWFKTGDLGFIDGDGRLSIIGRKKEIIVTTNGKNISPDKIESKLNLIAEVAYALVVGHRKKYLTALLTIDQEKIIDQKLELVNQNIKKNIDKINHSLEPYERIRDYKILSDDFNINNGTLTPTLKLRRQIIENNYRKIIDKMYQVKQANF